MRPVQRPAGPPRLARRLARRNHVDHVDPAGPVDPAGRAGRAGRRAGRADRGSMALELVIAAPALMVLLLVLSAGGEWINVTGAVGAAARDSARAASLARSLSAAQTDAQQAASADLGDICYGTISRPVINLYRDGQLDTNQDAFATAQEVQVTVSCVANLGVFRDVGYKAGHTFTAAAFAPLDPFVDRGQ